MDNEKRINPEERQAQLLKGCLIVIVVIYIIAITVLSTMICI